MTQEQEKREPKQGDMVKCNYNFDQEREKWQIAYPHKGDYLIIKEVLRNFVTSDLLLLFEDLRLSTPLNADCFDVVQRESEGDTVLNEAYKIANKL